VQMQFLARNAGYRAAHPQGWFAIIEQDGSAIGRIVIDDATQAAHIVDFALLPGCRTRGLGTAILGALLPQLGRGGRPVRCMVLETNQASLRMCRKVGFVSTGADGPFVNLAWVRAAAD
ncbi:MAG TPA: GNAT family N-acetyltransferase, partial [Rhodopila sp.]|nr:GNAT family N-acetyltransferase [Rhodopila sp.]